ncbi:uncharacterized protein [Diabrotica undecimpunctata]|uniref:uncharacterized protein n=1 Tax=Diabrotica undecimpunctata TaxID=50387 RepID=UPI003B63DE69
MFIPHKPTSPPRIRIDEHIITPSDNLKYLGLTFDTGLLWLDHVKANRKKAADIGHKLFIIAGRDWGRSPKTLKAIYENAVKPMLLYGAEIWGKRDKDTRIAKQLAAAERPFLRAITKAYKTAPTAALHILAGTIPLSVDAFATYKIFTDNKEDINELKLRTTDIPHPTNRTIKTPQDIQSPDTKVYVDASVKTINNVKSASIGVYIESTHKQIRLNRKVNTNDNINIVEALALAISTNLIKQDIQEYANKNIVFYTDSASVLAQLENGNCKNKIINNIKKNLEFITKFNIKYNITKMDRNNQNHKIAHNLAKEDHNNPQDTINITTKHDINKIKTNIKLNTWQQNWDRDEKGRKTYNILQTVKIAEPVYTWKAIQLLIGHGHMQDYYRRFNLRDTNGKCDQCNVPEDQHHIINTCMIVQRITTRQTLTQRLRQKQGTYQKKKRQKKH